MKSSTARLGWMLLSGCLAVACSGPRPAPPFEGRLPAATGADLAHQWRRLAWRDEHGKIPDDALLVAMRQRRANANFWHNLAVAQGLAAGTVQKAGMNPGAWESHGPGNVGGRTRALVIHPEETNRMWAGSVSGGLWYSTDRGASWSAVDDWWASLAIGCLVIDPHDPDVMYAGTGEGYFNGDAIRGAGIYKSIDGGVTWMQLPATAGFDNVCRIAISPDDPDVLLAGTRFGGIRRSTDGGDSWTTVNPAQGSFYVAFDPADGLNAIAHVMNYDDDWFHAALYSEDGGVSWNEATPLEHVDGFGSRIELAYAPSDPSIVYASVATDGGAVWRSQDGGHTYDQQPTGNDSAVNWYANPLWVEPIDPDTLLTGGYNIYGSVTGGANLFQMSDGYIMTEQPHVDIHGFAADPGYDGAGNRRVFVCNDGGVWMADDLYAASPTGGWTRRDQGYRTVQFYGAAGHGPTGILTGGTQDNGTLTFSDIDDQAVLTFGGDGGFAAIDPANPDYIYGEYIFLQIHRSTNGGLSAGYIYSGIADAGDNNDANFIAPFILDPNDPDTMLAGGRSLWRSANVKAGFPSWTAIKGPGTDLISAIAVAPGNPDVIWVGQNNGEVYKTANGTAGSPTWTAVDDNGATDPIPDRYVTRILIDPDDDQTVYLALGGFTPGNVGKTTNGGATWSNASGVGPTGLPHAPVRGIARHPTQPNWLYAGTEVGLFASDDGGATWSTNDFGPAAVSIDEVVFMHDSNRLLAATHGRGLFTIPIGNAGDANGDGVVDIDDFLIVIGTWGPCPAPPDPCPGDVDGDGEVGIGDFLLVLGNWG